MAKILVAAEIQDLLDQSILKGHTIEWMDPEHPVPAGNFDAVIPIILRPFGHAELDGLPNLKIVANYGNEVLELDLSERSYQVVEEGGEWRMCGYR